MKLEELINVLQTEQEFRNIDKWVFEKISVGNEGLHSYSIPNGQKRYFVKDVKDNEANTLTLIAPLKLEHFIHVIYPGLLMKNVLVAEFVSGKTLTMKNLHPGLIRDFAQMQNRLNDVEYFNRNNPQKYSLCRFSDRDNGFFRRGYTESFELGYRNLINLRERYSPSIVQKFIQLVEFLTEDKERIVDELANMPFTWQHHDFREENIIGEKQVLVDWGSSYGYGPFMYDLAPFLLNNPRSLEVYTGSSEICRKEAKSRIERWVYVSAAVRVMDILRYQLENAGPANFNIFKEFFEYEYKTYKFLLPENLRT